MPRSQANERASNLGVELGEPLAKIVPDPTDRRRLEARGDLGSAGGVELCERARDRDASAEVEELPEVRRRIADADAPSLACVAIDEASRLARERPGARGESKVHQALA